MLTKTVKVNIKVRRRKKVASGSIAIFHAISFIFLIVSAQFRTLSTFSPSGIPLSSASYKIKAIYNEIEETSQPAITS